MKFATPNTIRRSRPALERHASGFTFVEVLAAMLFMAIVLPAAIHAIVLANRAAVVAERKTIAAQLADNYLTELILAESWQNMPASGKFTGAYQAYEWRLERRNWEIDAMIYLEVQVIFTVQGREHQVRTGTLVEKPAA